MAKLTATEQEALMQAMKASYGNCTCGAVGSHAMHCDGHRFLGEVQMFAGALQDRVSILTYYRRMARLYTTAEFSQPFTLEAPQPSPLPESITRSRESPQSGDASNKLPW